MVTNIKKYNIIRADSYSRYTGELIIYIKDPIRIINVQNITLTKKFWFLKWRSNKNENIEHSILSLYTHHQRVVVQNFWTFMETGVIHMSPMQGKMNTV